MESACRKKRVVGVRLSATRNGPEAAGNPGKDDWGQKGGCTPKADLEKEGKMGQALVRPRACAVRIHHPPHDRATTTWESEQVVKETPSE